jgi:membrane-associated protease RseP (regulator of RpoE activity)
MMSMMANPDERFKVTVQRPVNGQTWVGTAELGVKLGPSETGGTRLSFGIGPAAALTVNQVQKYTTTKEVDPFQEGDQVLAIAGEPLAGTWQVEPLLAGLSGLTVPVKVLRAGKLESPVSPRLPEELWTAASSRPAPPAPPRGSEELTLIAPRGAQFTADTVYLKDGTKLNLENVLIAKDDKDKDSVVLTSLADGSKTSHKRADLIVAQGDEILDLLGMVPRLRLTGITPGSPAEMAGLKPGDVVLHYGDNQTPTIEQLMKISEKVGLRDLDPKAKGLPSSNATASPSGRCGSTQPSRRAPGTWGPAGT